MSRTRASRSLSILTVGAILPLLLALECAALAQLHADADEAPAAEAPAPGSAATQAVELSSAAVAEKLSEADALYRARVEPANARRALGIYRELYASTHQSAAAWRLAMGCYFVGLRQTADSGEKAKIFDEGRAAGLAGAAADKDCVECHFWGAINLALYGDTVGPFKMLFALGEIRDHLERSLELDPGYAYGGAYRLLGLIEQKLPGILGGDNDRAREYFRKAIAVAPGEPLNYLFMARLLDETLHDRGGSLEVARKGLAVSTPSAERLESIESLAELRKLLAQAR